MGKCYAPARRFKQGHTKPTPQEKKKEKEKKKDK